MDSPANHHGPGGGREGIHGTPWASRNWNEFAEGKRHVHMVLGVLHLNPDMSRSSMHHEKLAGSVSVY